LLALSFIGHREPHRLTAAFSLVLSVGFVIGSRALARSLTKRFYSNPAVTIPLVIAGANSVGYYVRDRIAEQLTQYKFVGFLDQNTPFSDRDPAVLGGFDLIEQLAVKYPHLEVMVVLPEASPELTQKIIKLCQERRVRWRVMPWLFQSPFASLQAEMVGIVPLIGPRNSNIEGLNYLIKRVFDLVAAATLLVIVSPAMLLAAGLVWLFDGRPLLFRQTRIGMHGHLFELFKLRTMRVKALDNIHREYVKGWIGRNGTTGADCVFKLRDDPRITKVGKWLRRFSIDEFPQLINVLRGEMSIIGPRPALPYELEYYQDWHRHRLAAPPGITGLWQVSGRNHLSFDEMVRLDIEYLEGWSFGLDMKIMLRTLPALFEGGGM
jgi:exopolysaccharide biosynthesis polyprenyl glycosylphosphotransferase